MFSITKETPPLRTINNRIQKAFFIFFGQIVCSLKREEEKKKYILGIRSINPHLINLTRILPQILDMPQQMPLSILTDQIPKIRS